MMQANLKRYLMSKIVLSLALSSSFFLPAVAQNNAPYLNEPPADLPNLRGPIQTENNPPAPTVPDGSSAKDMSDRDFQLHIDTMKQFKKSIPPVSFTGASPTKILPILRNQTENGSGPSTINNQTPDTEIDISRTKLKSLIQINDYIDPFSLDAKSKSLISLREALRAGIERNLDLAISRTSTKQRQFSYYSALGNFLPDPTLGFSEYFSRGKIGLPTNGFSLGGSSAGNALSSSSSSLGSSTFARSDGEVIRINRPFEIMHAGAEFFAYRGGRILFTGLQSRNNYRAQKHSEHATLSDTLLTVTKNYHNLVLSEVLLDIRIDAVKTSEEQLRRNQDRKAAGLATNLDVLQSKTQLSRDRQALVDQQTNRRNASLDLAESLNMPFAEDLSPVDLRVQKIRLIDSKMDINHLLGIAIDSRPELKQYEELRLAAKKAIMISMAKLQPTVLLGGQAYGIGPPGNVQALGTFFVNINWRLTGMGVVDSMDTVRAKWEARQAQIQAQKELQTVCKQVRTAYLQILDREKNIEESTSEVNSALEELRLAELRKASGLGLNLDIITAQRDYTEARVNKAQAIINFNIAQAQLLHDIGMISTEAITSGRLLSKAR